MFDLYGCYFMYGDFNSEDYDLVFGNMDTSRLMALEASKNINTVRSRKHNVHYVNRVSYVDEPISFEAEIFTSDATPIMFDDLPYIEHSLFNRHTYTKLYQVMAHERNPIYINCILTNPEKIENTFGVVGYKFVVNMDSVMAWEETNTQETFVDSTSTTLTGDVVSFIENKEYPIKQLSADITAVQNLNGYGAPWVGGAGKNKLHITATTATQNDVTFTVNSDGTISLSGTASADTNFILNTTQKLVQGVSYHIAGIPATGTGSNYYLMSTRGLSAGNTTLGFGQAATATSEALYLFLHVSSGVNTNGVVIKPMICLATETDYTFAPYSNICPISGWDEVKVCDDGKYAPFIKWAQLVQINVGTGANITITQDEDGVVSLSGTASGSSKSLQSNLIHHVSGHNYIFLFSLLANPNNLTFTIGMSQGNPWITTVNEVKAYDRIYTSIYNSNLGFYDIAGKDMTGVKFTLQVCDLTEMFGAGNEPTIAEFKALFPNDYYPYNAGEVTCVSAVNGEPYRLYTIDLDGTRYGGTLDVTTGVLTATHRYLEVSSCNSVGTASTNVQYASISLGSGNGANSDHSTNISSSYKQTESAPQTDGYFRLSGTTLYIYDNRFTDKETANTVLASELPQVVYKLTTPQTYQLDPRQVYTLVGNNNIWSDTGNITISYNQTNDFHIDVDTDLSDYIYPDVEIQIGSDGGDIIIYNATDDATRFTEFSSVPPLTTFTMKGSINHITNNMYSYFTSRNFIRLVNGRNNFFMYGDIERITFRFNNRKYM